MEKRLLAVTLLMIGCQNHVDEKKISWNSDSQSPTPRIEEIKGLSQENELKLKSHKIDFYNQKIDGLRVDDTLLKVLATNEGDSLVVNGSYIENPSVDAKELEKYKTNYSNAFTKLLSSQSDLQKMKLLNQEIILGKSGRRLVILNSFLTEDNRGQIWKIHSKQDGRFVSMTSMGSNFENQEAQLFPRGPKLSPISRVQLFEINLGKDLMSSGLRVASILNNMPFLHEELLSLTPGSEKFDQLQVFYFSQQALRWIDEKLKIKLNDSLDVQVHAGAPEKTNMAFYYSNKIRIGSGDGEVYARIPQDPTIVAHETFHAVIDQMSRLPFQGEGGSINEGLADTLTVFHLGQANLGEVSYLKGPYKRSVENKDKFTERNGGLYHDSLILSGLMWEFRNKIGHEKTLNLIYNLLLKLGPSSDFDELKNLISNEIKNVYEAKELEMATQILKERAWIL